MLEDAIKQEARLIAIEYVLTHVAKAAYLRFPAAVIELAHTNIRQGLREESFPGADPALADHFSAEISENVDRLLADIECAVAEGREPKT